MNVAQSVRLQKEKHPANYCAHPRCLWRIVNGRTGESTPCQRHPARSAVNVEAELAQSRAIAGPHSVDRADLFAAIMLSLAPGAS